MEDEALLGSQVELIMRMVSVIDKDALQARLNKWQENLGVFEAVGIMRGISYLEEVRILKNLYKRLEAFCNLVEVFHSTGNELKGVTLENLTKADLILGKNT